MTLRENNLMVTQKYSEIHAVNTEKAIYRPIYSFQSQIFCGSEVSRKIKELEVKGGRGHLPQCSIAGDANDAM